MTSRKVFILAAVAIAVLTAALLLSRKESSQVSKPSAALYPSLKSELNSVTAIRIFKASDARSVELTRKDADWSVSERAGYPADAGKARRLLLALADAKTVEEKTSNPASYPALSVEDVSSASATGSRIELAGVATPVNLIVGKSAGAKGSYVRRAGEPVSWLIDQSIEASSAPNEWLRTSILDVGADRVQAATVATEGAKPYTAQKAARADADFKPDFVVPKGKELDKFAINGFANALTALTLSDVHPAKDFEADKPAAHTTFRTFDGLVVDLDGWTKDGKHYLSATTGYDEAQAARFHVDTKAPEKAADAKPESPAAAKPAPADIEKPDDKAKAMDAQLKGWVYEVPDYKYEAIFKPAASLTKDTAPPAKKQ
jgi:hypothetical protein